MPTKRNKYGTATIMQAKQLEAQADMNRIARRMMDNMTASVLPHIEARQISHIWNAKYYSYEADMTKKLHELEHIPDHVKLMFDRVTEDDGKHNGRNFVWLRNWEELKANLLMIGVVFETPTDKFPESDCPIKVPFMDGYHVIGEGHAINCADLDIYYGIKNGAYLPHEEEEEPK